jgi:hypothetical protein
VNFADRLIEFAASENAQHIARIRRQAEERARINGIDAGFAANEAERLWHPGASHEPIVAEVAGAFRRTA